MKGLLLDRVPDDLWYRGSAPSAPVQIRYLGTAGFVVESEGHTLVIDPFVTRPNLATTLTRRLIPDEAAIRRIIPKADDVLIGHSHHDHVLDGPSLCRQTGARFIGSPDAANVALAAGLELDQILPTKGREDIETASGLVRGIPSDHGRVYFNRIPLRGPIEKPPPWPPRMHELRHGLVFNWYAEVAGLRIVHIDSAEFFENELTGFEADVVCLCAIGRHYRPDYVADCIRLLKPRLVVACHWDYFFTPYDAPALCLPGVDLPGFVREIEQCGAEPVVLPFDGILGVS